MVWDAILTECLFIVYCLMFVWLSGCLNRGYPSTRAFYITVDLQTWCTTPMLRRSKAKTLHICPFMTDVMWVKFHMFCSTRVASIEYQSFFGVIQCNTQRQCQCSSFSRRTLWTWRAKVCYQESKSSDSQCASSDPYMWVCDVWVH